MFKLTHLLLGILAIVCNGQLPECPSQTPGNARPFCKAKKLHVCGTNTYKTKCDLDQKCACPPRLNNADELDDMYSSDGIDNLVVASCAAGLSLGGADQWLGMGLAGLAAATFADASENNPCYACVDPNPNRPQPPTPAPQPTPKSHDGSSACLRIEVKIELKVDKYGRETTMTLSRQGESGSVLEIKDVEVNGTKTAKTDETECIKPGKYTLRVEDKGGDGICCKMGKGKYKMWVNDQLQFQGGSFTKSATHTIRIGSYQEEDLGIYAKDQTEAHNKERRKYHELVGLPYSPLRWSDSLAEEAQAYAEKLQIMTDKCDKSPEHSKEGSDDNLYGDGENIASEKGHRSTFGRLRTPTEHMSRYVDKEINWPQPNCSHLTQVLWRASLYMGCGKSVKRKDPSKGENSPLCRFTVCRYRRAGNCKLPREYVGNSLNPRYGKTYRKPEMSAWKEDYSACGLEHGGAWDCPVEGCFI